MLAVGAVHLCYMSNPRNQAGAMRISSSARHRVLALVDQATKDGGGRLSGRDIDLILAALLSCIMASVRVSSVIVY